MSAVARWCRAGAGGRRPRPAGRPDRGGTARRRPGRGRRPRGSAALTQAGLTAYDVIVLDRDLPGVHGDQVCRTLAGGSARILMLAAGVGLLATL
jgi:hypothetical protein